MLLALAVIASEEIAVLPFLHGSNAARLLEAQTGSDGVLDRSAPVANLALAAIGAAHQGVFDLDFRAQLLTLSPDAALMAGLPAHKVILSHSDWMARLNPEDRETIAARWRRFAASPVRLSDWNSAPRGRAAIGAGWSFAPASSPNRMCRRTAWA